MPVGTCIRKGTRSEAECRAAPRTAYTSEEHSTIISLSGTCPGDVHSEIPKVKFAPQFHAAKGKNGRDGKQ